MTLPQAAAHLLSSHHFPGPKKTSPQITGWGTPLHRLLKQLMSIRDMTCSNSITYWSRSNGHPGCALCPGSGREGLQCPVALIHAWKALQLTGMPMLSWLKFPALILLAPKLCPALDVNLILLGANGVKNLTHLFLLCRREPYGSWLLQRSSIWGWMSINICSLE